MKKQKFNSMKELGLRGRAHKINDFMSKIKSDFIAKYPELKQGSLIKIMVGWDLKEVILLEKPTMENNLIVETNHGKLNVSNLKEVTKY